MERTLKRLWVVRAANHTLWTSSANGEAGWATRNDAIQRFLAAQSHDPKPWARFYREGWRVKCLWV